MTPIPLPLMCLLGYATWTILLVTALGVCRIAWVARGKKRATDFPSGTPHGPDWYWRLNRAHMNAVENLPVFGAIVVVGMLARPASPMLACLPPGILGARIAQSIIHVSSGAKTAVSLRFTAFLAQVAGLLVLAASLAFT